MMAIDGLGLAKDGPHADALGADDVLADDVANKYRIAGVHADLPQRLFENPRVRLADAYCARIDAYREKLEQVVQLKMLIEHEARDEGVGDQRQLQAAVAELG